MMTKKKWLRAATSVPSLVAAGTAATVALLLHSWPIVAIGVVACAALALVDAKKKDRLPPTTIAPPTKIEDPHTAHAVMAILAARREVEKSVDATDAGAMPMLATIADLDARTAKLVRRAEEIAAHLRKGDTAALRREIEHLAARIAATTDETTRSHYAAARSARVAHLETLAELARTKERIGATLLSIAATLDALPAKVVRLRDLDGGSADATRDIGHDLAAMNDEIASFEETLLQIHGDR